MDICQAGEMRQLFERYQPRAVFHLAAESHVDRSIDGPMLFLHTNVVGTCTLLAEARRYYVELDETEQTAFRFIDGRGVRFPGIQRVLHGGLALRPELAVRGEQGSRGSLRARVAAGVRPARHRHELLQ